MGSDPQKTCVISTPPPPGPWTHLQCFIFPLSRQVTLNKTPFFAAVRSCSVPFIFSFLEFKHTRETGRETRQRSIKASWVNCNRVTDRGWRRRRKQEVSGWSDTQQSDRKLHHRRFMWTCSIPWHDFVYYATCVRAVVRRRMKFRLWWQLKVSLVCFQWNSDCRKSHHDIIQSTKGQRAEVMQNYCKCEM